MNDTWNQDTEDARFIDDGNPNYCDNSTFEDDVPPLELSPADPPGFD